MAKNTRISPAQIIRNQNILRELQEKNNKKTYDEVAKILEKAFKKVFQKGYTQKKIASILKNVGIVIPVYMVKKFLTS